MTQSNTSEQDKKRSAVGRAAETAVDVGIGGSALVAGKAVDAIDELAQRGDKALRSTRREVEEKAHEAQSKVHDAARSARKAVEPHDTRVYEERTRDELYELAAEREVDGRSTMNKDELIAALRAER